MIVFAGQIEPQLAPVFNHALFQKLHPEALHSVADRVDKFGDAELLNLVSEIDGLEDIALLVDVLNTEDARVHITIP